MQQMQTLSLSELHTRDPQHKQNRTECDCACPFCSNGKRPGPTNRTLSYNTKSGAWICHRCHEKGILTDFQDAMETTRPQRAHRQLNRLFSLPESKTELAADVESGDWKAVIASLQPLAMTPGAAYLAGRGIPLDVAQRSRVKYHPSLYGRPAVIFPIYDTQGNLTACNGRYIDNKVDSGGNRELSGRTVNRFEGGLKRGVFTTPGALEAKAPVITEAPIDALSLAAAGVPAMALCGVTVREWMAARLAWKTVYLAFDNDPVNAQGKKPGEEAFHAWEAVLLPFGAHVERLRPSGVKDWNDALQKYGLEAMREALASLFARKADADPEPDEEAQAVYTGDYVFIEDLALQDWLPRKFRAVPEGPVMDMNAWVRRAVTAQDAALLEQIESAFEAWRKPLLAAMNEPDWW